MSSNTFFLFLKYVLPMQRCLECSDLASHHNTVILNLNGVRKS